MRNIKFSRRDVLKGSSALTVGTMGGTLFAEPLRAAAPPPEAITPALIEAAKKEGKVVFYTAMDLAFAERLGRSFEAKFPGISARVERSGAERVFTRIDQEYKSNVRAVDVVNTADQAHVIMWKRSGWLAQYLPEEVAKHYDKKYYDPEGFEVVTRVLVSPCLSRPSGLPFQCSVSSCSSFLRRMFGIVKPSSSSFRLL
jgi:iron(III) transport system substrate-binding protein